MTALTADFNAPHSFKERRTYFPVAASTTIYCGAIVALVGGYLVAASDAAGLNVVGRAEALADNSAGANGDIKCEVAIGTFRWNNDPGAGTLDQTDVGTSVYVLDDNTVSSTAGTNSIVAGVLEHVDSDGAWVRTSL